MTPEPVSLAFDSALQPFWHDIPLAIREHIEELDPLYGETAEERVIHILQSWCIADFERRRR